MSNTVKKMSKLSLFLVGLVVAFNVTSCDCNKDKKDAKIELKQSEKKKLKLKATEEIADTSLAIVESSAFKDLPKKVTEVGGKAGKVEKDKEFEIELTAKDDATEGDAKIEVKVGTKVVAELTVTIKKK